MASASFVKPMKAVKVDAVPTGSDWVMEPKFDGWRCEAVIIETTTSGDHWDKTVLLYTNTGKIIGSVPYINQALEALPVGTILDGEIVDLSGGAQWNRTQSICSRDSEHIPRECDPAVTYAIFDCLEADGTSLMTNSLRDRRSVASVIVEKLNSPYVILAEQWEANEEAADRLVAEGWEGVVCKRLSGTYSPGSRNKGWVKFKPFKEVEAVVTGTYEATEGSKYDGTHVGGITFRLTHEDGSIFEGRCAGKMHDGIRKELYDTPEKFIGLVVEITHWGVGEDGALRHPQYRRFRDPADKHAPTHDHEAV